MMALISATESENGIQTFQSIEAFFILKIVLAVLVLPLLMYSCRQKYAKYRYPEKNSFNTSDHESRPDSRTKSDNLPEKSSDTVVQNEVKKRRVRKKKPRKQNTEYSEENKDTNAPRDGTEKKSAGEEVKIVQRRNKAVHSNGPDLEKDCSRRQNDSRNPDTAGQVEHNKFSNRCNKGYRKCDPDSAPFRGVNNSENSDCATGGKDSVKSVTKCDNFVGRNGPGNSQRRVRDSSCTVEQTKDAERLVMSENNDLSSEVEDVKQIYDKWLNEVVTSESKKTKVLTENPDLSSQVEDVKKVAASKQKRSIAENHCTAKTKDATVPNGGSRLIGQAIRWVLNQDSVRWDLPASGNRNRPHQTPNDGGSSLAKTQENGDVKGSPNPEHSGVAQRRKSFSDNVKKDTSGMELKEKASTSEPSQEYAKKRSAGGLPARRWEKTNRDSTTAENRPTEDNRRVSTTPRRRSFDRTFQKDFRGKGPPEHNRAYPTDDQTTSDEPENPELENRPTEDNRRAGTTPRRRSFDRTFQKDFRGKGPPEHNRAYPTDDRTTSDEPENPELANKPTKDHRRIGTTPRRRSFDRSFEKDFGRRGQWEHHRPGPTDGRTTPDEPRDPELEERPTQDHRRVGTTPRRRSFDRSFENDFRGSGRPEHHRHCPTDGRTTSEELKNPELENKPVKDHRRVSATPRRRSFDRTWGPPKHHQPFPSDDRTTSDEPGNPELEKKPTQDHRRVGTTPRRRSFDHSFENDFRGNGRPEHNRPCPTDGRTTSEEPKNPELENKPVKDNMRVSATPRRRSFDRTWGPPEHHRPFPSYDRTTSNEPGNPELENKPAEDPKRDGATRRRRSFDRSFEKDLRERRDQEHHRPCPTGGRTTSDKPGNPELECREGKTIQSAEVTSDRFSKMERKDNASVEENAASPGSLTAPKVISEESAKNKDMLNQDVQVRPAASQEPQMTPDGHVLIDPEVRERIAKPEYPIVMPEKPYQHLSFYDFNAHKGKKSTNKSFVHGLFGREWRERMEKEQEERWAEEDAKSDEEVIDIRDNICPTFMIWGVCHRGDRCHLRHPSYRYLERPKKKAAPEPVQDDPKPQNPNSYAAILEKTRDKKPQGFVNDAVSKKCKGEETLEEAWPALGSPPQEGNIKVPKAWGPKRDTPIIPQAWEPLSSSTEKAPRISLVDQQQLANDELIADALQAEEYAQLGEYDGNEEGYDDEYNYYAEEDLNGDEHFEEDEHFEDLGESNSSEAPPVGKVVPEEPFNTAFSSPVILEQSTEGENEEPAPPKISNICDICMDRPKDATLVCGHRYCYQCALQMRVDERVCAICRRCIVSVIKTYN